MSSFPFGKKKASINWADEDDSSDDEKGDDSTGPDEPDVPSSDSEDEADAAPPEVPPPFDDEAALSKNAAVVCEGASLETARMCLLPAHRILVRRRPVVARDETPVTVEAARALEAACGESMEGLRAAEPGLVAFARERARVGARQNGRRGDGARASFALSILLDRFGAPP